MTEKETNSLIKNVNVERIPLSSWPSYFIQRYMKLNYEQSYILDNLLKTGSKPSYHDLNISIFDKIIKNSTIQEFSPTIGIFFVLDFYEHKHKKSEEFVQLYREHYFYSEFSNEIVNIIKPLEEQDVLSTPEEFFSVLVASNFKNSNLRNQSLSYIHDGRDIKQSLLGIVNQFRKEN